MIVGPSGCGKTTLLSILGAILTQDGGDCRVFGRDLREMSEAEKLRFRAGSIGFVFQMFNLLPALTIVDNVSIPLLLNGISRREARHRAEHLLDRVGLNPRADTLPAQLSGGQQQRVAIARALVHGPSLVVCDEPTSNLDHATGESMMARLCELAAAAERTLIVVTHDTRILGFADRIAYMEDGRITRVAKPANTGQSQ
jgi:putative ABC transport system ATP-binding protein